MLFAADDPAQGWVAIVVQGGAIAILGYHLLRGLPDMLDKQMSKMMELIKAVTEANAATTRETSQKNAAMVADMLVAFRETLREDRDGSNRRATEDRAEFGNRNQALVEELGKLRESFPAGLAPKFDALVDELKRQTEVINGLAEATGEQSKELHSVAEKMNEWPSDWKKLCNADSLKCHADDALRQAGIAAGFDEKLINRLLDLQKKRRGSKA